MVRWFQSHHSIPVFSKCYTFRFYKIDYHSFIKQESTEFTALPNKKVIGFGKLRHAAYSQKTWFAAYDGKKDEFIVW